MKNNLIWHKTLKSCANKHFIGRMSIKTLSAAVLIGTVGIFTPSFAADISNLPETDENGNINYNFESANDVYTLQKFPETIENKTLNINGVADGDLRSTIDLNGKRFSLSNSEANIKNVEIKNGWTAIQFNNSSANFENVKIFNNEITSGNLGTIGLYFNQYIEPGDIQYQNTNINSSIFSNNCARIGGALNFKYDIEIDNRENDQSLSNIATEAIAVNIKDSVFEGNRAVVGGAILATGYIWEYRNMNYSDPKSLDISSEKDSAKHLDALTIKNSKFINNVADYIKEPPPTRMQESLNETRSTGGAIATNVNTNIENSIFENNRVKNGYGGAIYQGKKNTM